ncbi:hypothetical protein E2P81_ATG05281 [Venturia nashicola]|uniref:DUF7053 domain-containing protein n=1 Tax=Venturia nashicola TaxID=86259 RepID=A0A4Z1P0B4_9PEZI|nr:hypothetical protein E6O75_ATG05412 [Venturia nashicola]TLD32305.1 hypothetical protein E2P81_ATG05281 [Venturia nashicola]
MSKRTHFTTITPLPPGVTRASVLETLRNHFEMIDLNPLVIERKRQDKAPPFAGPEEYHATWYRITDNIKGLPGTTTYHGCFHDLADGLQTHVYAPAGLDIRGKWQLGGTLPGEPTQTAELGLNIPKQGLYLREDVDMKCNFLLTSFVKKTLKKSHATLVARLLEKANLREAASSDSRIEAWRSQTGSDAGSDVGSVYGSNRYNAAVPSTRQSMASSTTPPLRGHSPGQPDATYQSHNHQDPRQSQYLQHQCQDSFNQIPNQNQQPRQEQNSSPYPTPVSYSNRPQTQPSELGSGFHPPAEARPIELPAQIPSQNGPAELAG